MKLSGRSLLRLAHSKLFGLRKRRHKERKWATSRANLHRHGKEFLADVYDASREVGIRPFLMWGTLLGCVREGGFLPTDRDIDLGILPRDYAKKDALVSAMATRGYSLATDRAYKFKFKRPFRLMIDIDVFYPWNGKMISCHRREDGTCLATYFPRAAFDRLKEIVFLDDIRVLIPDPPASVLAAIYGDWRIPVRTYSSERDLHNRLRISPGDPMPQLSFDT